MIERYKLPKQFNIETKFLYKSEQVWDDFFEKNPQLKSKYPTRDEIINAYELLKQTTLKGMKSIMEITEDGIKLHENISLL